MTFSKRKVRLGQFVLKLFRGPMSWRGTPFSMSFEPGWIEIGSWSIRIYDEGGEPFFVLKNHYDGVKLTRKASKPLIKAFNNLKRLS